MSTGLAPVRGALFTCAIVLLGVGAVAATSVSGVASPDAPFRMLWVSDLGAESSATERAASRDGGDVVTARVPGAAYVLAVDGGSARKIRRLAADYSMVYGLARSGAGDVVLAADDGAISLWSTSARLGGAQAPRWRRELGERAVSVGWDGGDDVWVTTRQGRLMALSAADGSTRWTARLGSRADAPPVRIGGALFVATKGQTLLRLDAATGKPEWTVELPGPAVHSPSPITAEADDAPAAILASTWNGQVLAADRETGATLWSVDVESRLAGAPVVGESFVAVPTEDGAVRAFDLKGEALWTSEGVAGERTDLLLHVGAAAESARLVAVSDRLSVLDVASGQLVDEYPAGAVADLDQRFLDVMLEGKRPYSETEKTSLLERESFPIRGRLFGRAELIGKNLVFGTEEGWIYWFDWASMRPICRYRAGQRASDAALVWANDTVIASVSESVFGVDPVSGDTLWRREVGPVTQLVGAETLAIVGEDRLDVLDRRTGARRWSARGAYRAVAVMDDGWLAFESTGAIQGLDDTGNAGGPSIAPLPSIDAVVGLGQGHWAVASAEGRVAAIAWDPTPRELWEIDLGQPIESVSRAETTLVVFLGDRLVGLSSLDGSSAWELPVEEGETPLLDQHVFIATAEVLRLYEPVGGTLVTEIGVEAKIVGATLVDDAIVWLDASGVAYRATLEAEADGSASTESVSLGDRLSRAAFENGSVLVTTDAGEIGLIELAPGRATLSSPSDFLQEEKK